MHIIKQRLDNMLRNIEKAALDLRIELLIASPECRVIFESIVLRACRRQVSLSRLVSFLIRSYIA
jgi:hypothetical protein